MRMQVQGFIRGRTASLSMVVLMLLLIVLLQSSISYTITFGPLARYVPVMRADPLTVGWFGLRLFATLIVVVLWIQNHMHALFRMIILANAIFTVGLLVNMLTLLAVLGGYTAQRVATLLTDVMLIAVTNVLIFSIWYWIIDPPGVEESKRDDAAWDFLFPQRAAVLPHYETWSPRYTDYLYVAFTTSYAFSPTDTMPLTRRAKLLMLLQSTISLITITGIAGSAINILAGAQ